MNVEFFVLVVVHLKIVQSGVPRPHNYIRPSRLVIRIYLCVHIKYIDSCVYSGYCD